MQSVNGQRGLIRTIVVVIIAILIVGYFGIDLKKVIESEQNKENFSYIRTVTTHVWNKYLAGPADYLWNDIFIDLIWESAIDNLTAIKEGRPTSLEQGAPKLPNPPVSD